MVQSLKPLRKGNEDPPGRMTRRQWRSWMKQALITSQRQGPWGGEVIGICQLLREEGIEL
jgi:hypothetical protein